MNPKKAPKKKATAQETPTRKMSLLQREERLEVLCQAEAIMIRAMNCTMRIQWGDELCWPAMVKRPDDTRVHVLDAAAELVLEQLEQFGRRLEQEITQLVDLPPEAVRRYYEITERRSKEFSRPVEKLQPKSVPGVDPKSLRLLGHGKRLLSPLEQVRACLEEDDDS